MYSRVIIQNQLWSDFIWWSSLILWHLPRICYPPVEKLKISLDFLFNNEKSAKFLVNVSFVAAEFDLTFWWCSVLNEYKLYVVQVEKQWWTYSLTQMNIYTYSYIYTVNGWLIRNHFQPCWWFSNEQHVYCIGLKSFIDKLRDRVL